MKKIFISLLVSLFFASPVLAVNYDLSTSAGNGGSVSGGGSYASGDTATVTATPNGGYHFTSWSGDLSGSANPASLTMDSDKSVSGSFAGAGAGPYWMTAQGMNGNVSVSNGSVKFLTRQFGKGGLLISKNPTGFIANEVGRALQGKATYDYKFTSNEVATYHTIQVSLKGTYYAIPFATDFNGFVYYGTEFQISL